MDEKVAKLRNELDYNPQSNVRFLFTSEYQESVPAVIQEVSYDPELNEVVVELEHYDA